MRSLLKGTNQTNQQSKGRTDVIWMLAGGIAAGMVFNLSFGSVVWNTEGVLGGLVSAILIYIIS